MGNRNRLEINDLRTTINSILDFIEYDLKKKYIHLPIDYYWVVPDDSLYSMSVTPECLDCGSLWDDIEFLKTAIEAQSQNVPLLLQHAAPLLYALSVFINPFEE